MVSIDVLAIVVGAIYGYVKPGKEQKAELLKKGAKFGIILGVILSLLNLVLGGGIILASATIIGTLIGIVYLTIMFIIGTFIGDFLEEKIKK
jgi:hypothetical protein